MANPSKQKGTAFESLIRDHLQEEWSPIVERMALSGSADRGDISNFRVGSKMQHLVTLELKNCAKMSLGTWISEAEVEAKNSGAIAGAVIHKRVRKGKAADQYVTLTLSHFLTILRAAAS